MGVMQQDRDTLTHQACNGFKHTHAHTMLLSVEKVGTVDLVFFKLSEERLWSNSQGITPPQHHHRHCCHLSLQTYPRMQRGLLFRHQEEETQKIGSGIQAGIVQR